MHPFVQTLFDRARVLDKWFWVFFGIFLSIQLYWRTLSWWDPVVYALNGKWFCGEKIYFEFLRPPVPSFLHCAFGATDFSPFLVVLFSCLVYLVGVILFFDLHVKKEKMDPFFFAAFAFLFPTILIHSNAGGDILALGFLLIAYSLEGSFSKGFFFGLATLSRYNYFLFLPILLLQKKWVKWPLILLGIFLIWSPWLYYNFAQMGDPLFSVSESIALNVQQKGIFQPLSLIDFGFLAFFALSVLVAFGGRTIQRLPTSLGVLTIVQYVASGIKETRFSIPLVPVQALLLSRIPAHFPPWKTIVSILLAICLAADVGLIFYFQTNPYVVDVPEDAFLHDCRVLSDKWVDLYAQGIIAEPLAPAHDWVSAVKNGNHLVIYMPEGYSPDSLAKLNVIDRGSYLIVKSPTCAPPNPFFISTVWRG